MPGELKGMAMLPSLSMAMAPPSPPNCTTTPFDHVLGCFRQRVAAVGHASADVARHDTADVELAPAGAGDRALVGGVGAGADDRRVADAAELLVGHAAGGGARGDVALRSSATAPTVPK
jgi:hypothetical protein